MAARILTPGCAEVEMIYQNAGQFVENVFHVQGPGDWAASDLTALCAVFKTWFSTNLKGLVGSGITLQSIKATDIGLPAGAQVVYTTGLPEAGSSGGNPYPNNVTVTITHQTGRRGRSFRGRSYFIGMTETWATASNINGDLQNALLAAFQALLTLLADFAIQAVLSVLSQRLNGEARVIGETTPILSFKVDPVIDSQRRRLPGRGR